MKTVKLNIIALLTIFLSSTAFAGLHQSQVIIQELSNDLISVKAELCDLDNMKVIIENEDGDVVFSDKLANKTGITSKTYDLSETKVGGYFIKVYCNDKLVESTVISDKNVTRKDSHYFVLN